MIESSNRIPLTPVTYKAGFEYCKPVAFKKEDISRVLKNLPKIAKVEVESKGTLSGHTARQPMTISVGDLFGSRTQRQLGALIQAIGMGYYTLPKKKSTTEQIARVRASQNQLTKSI